MNKTLGATTQGRFYAVCCMLDKNEFSPFSSQLLDMSSAKINTHKHHADLYWWEVCLFLKPNMGDFVASNFSPL